jgi:hypothetical protein
VSDIPGPELVACALLSYAKTYGEKGILRGDFESLAKSIAPGAVGFGMWMNDDVLRASLEILVDARVATVGFDPYSSAYYKIDSTALSKVLTAAAKENAAWQKKLEKADANGDLDTILDTGRRDDFPLARAHSNYPVLRQYNEFGDDWLQRLLKSVNDRSIAADDDHSSIRPHDSLITSTATEPQVVYHPPIDSQDWTGIAVRMNAAKLVVVKDQVNALLLTIDQSDCDERTKRNARKHAQAVITLLEAPDPPWKVIVELLNNPIFTAFLNTAAVLSLIFGS